jgi:hypothetical protein
MNQLDETKIKIESIIGFYSLYLKYLRKNLSKYKNQLKRLKKIKTKN